MPENNDERFELEVENLQLLNTFSLENLQDISQRKDNISKDIVIKGSKNNNMVLGNLYDISRYSSDSYTQELQHNFKANRSVKCILLENGIQILTGSLMVKNIVVKANNDITYNCLIIGEVVSFFIEMKERKLEQLDSIRNTEQMYPPDELQVC